MSMDSNLIIKKISLEKEKIKDQNHKDIVLKKLTGRTLETIGSEYNVTRDDLEKNLGESVIMSENNLNYKYIDDNK